MSNRVFKFKAFDRKKKMIVNVLKIDLWGADYELRNIYTSEGQTLSAGEFELLQFTGLHDKNGVEIYEGDIINDLLNGSIETVGFRSGFFGCTGLKGKGFGGFFGKLCEVIGNKFENPELLEASNE